jgi:hypothetical protein
MKSFRRILTLTLVTAMLSLSLPALAAEGTGPALKGRKTFGFGMTGYIDLSTYEQLYVSFRTNHYTAYGIGFQLQYEQGLTDHLTLGGQIGYAYLVHASQSSSPNFYQASKRNLFHGDLLVGYHFMNEKSIQPYLKGGFGMAVSATGVAPLAVLGGGADFFLTDGISLRPQALYKTSITHNRIEASINLGIHF